MAEKLGRWPGIGLVTQDWEHGQKLGRGQEFRRWQISMAKNEGIHRLHSFGRSNISLP